MEDTMIKYVDAELPATSLNGEQFILMQEIKNRI